MRVFGVDCYALDFLVLYLTSCLLRDEIEECNLVAKSLGQWNPIIYESYKILNLSEPSPSPWG